ncbi:MAG: hypothetical protein KBA75_04345 [Alphaproteobacteria bacterium]|nr:hypothetical protein [Alphaproteobacteria bacterium]
MSSKFRPLLFCLATLLVAGLHGAVAVAKTVSPDSLAAYEAGIKRSCQTDADCVVKDVHNCCGYYPSCVNKTAKTDTARVQKLCAMSALTSICGFPEISNCACSNGACHPSNTDTHTLAPRAQ